MNSQDGNTAGIPRAQRGKLTISLTVTGLVALSICLIFSTAALTHVLESGPLRASASATTNTKPTDAKTSSRSSPWGELVTVDVDIEQPEEYVSWDKAPDHVPTWVFTGRSVQQVRTLMESSGLTESQINLTLAEGKVESTPDGTVVKPDYDTVLSLSPDVRSKLYLILSQWPANVLMAQPYHMPDENFDTELVRRGMSQDVIAMVKQLTYPRGGKHYFSDPEIVLRAMTIDKDRIHFLKTLTDLPAVIARLHVGPESDIDKILGYWTTTPLVRFKDLRPLLDSLKNKPEGGSVSILYFLPPFAREHLYSFPLPGKPGEVRMDCHWSSLNFFNEQPDDRFQDATYASNYIRDHFYEIGMPTMIGDLIFLLNPQGQVIHSAVYIADDIVFTKNGFNIGQPWMLMRLNKLRDIYAVPDEPMIKYYRRKEI